MNMNKQILPLGLLSILLTACSGVQSAKVDPMQERDKAMLCDEIELDINEAEFLKQQASSNGEMTFSNAINPFAYPSTLMSSNRAEEAAQQRIQYLTRIYEIRNCSDPVVREAERRTRKPADTQVAALEAQNAQGQPPVAPQAMQQPYGYAPYAAQPQPYAPAPYAANPYAQPVSPYGYQPPSYGYAPYAMQQPVVPQPSAPQSYGLDYAPTQASLPNVYSPISAPYGHANGYAQPVYPPQGKQLPSAGYSQQQGGWQPVGQLSYNSYQQF